MKLKFEIIMTTFLGLVAICMNCNPSQKISEPTVSVDTISPINAPLFETHWKLVELMGHKIQDSSIKKEMYLCYSSVSSRLLSP